MHKQFVFIFILSLLCSTSPAAFAAKAACESIPDTITVGSPREGWPPFLIVKERGEHEGIMFDVIREITGRLNYKVDFVFFPEMRSRMLLDEGSIHAYPKAKEWVDDPSVYLWSDPIVISEDILVTRANHKIHFKVVHDLVRTKIGTVYGFTYPSLEEAFASDLIHHHTAKDTESTLRMVQRAHLDGAVTNRHVAEWIVRNQPDMEPGEFAYSKTIIGSAPYRFAFNNDPKWEEFVKCFNRELAAMKSDGRLQAIFDKYK